MRQIERRIGEPERETSGNDPTKVEVIIRVLGD